MEANSLFTPGPRKPWAATALRFILVGVAGLFLFRFGLPGVILGGPYVAGGAEVTPQLDSETRFLSAIALGVGVGAIWLVRNFERAPGGVALLSTFAALGGILRVVSMFTVGMPDFIAQVATVLEFGIPATALWLLTQHART